MTLLSDLRYASRQLRRAPGFALTAVLTLALGIGATTAIFTLVYDVLLKPLPYPHPRRLVVAEEQVAEFRDIYPTLPMNANHFAVWKRNAHSFQSFAVMEEDSEPLGLGSHPMKVEVVSATPGIFPVLGVLPQLGRAFTEQEAKPGHDREIVLLNDLWRTQFGSDPHVVGKMVTLNGFPYTIIGVMPASFHLPRVTTIAVPNADAAHPAEALIPLAFTDKQLSEAMDDFNYFGLARLKPGVSLAQASAEINALQHRISVALPADEGSALSATLTPLQQALVGNNRRSLLLLLAAVAGLLLVGCINIANLLLSRSIARQRRMSIAAALGASFAEMLRSSLCESAALASLGGVAGVLLASTLVPWMQRYLPPALDFRGALHLDWAGAACAVSLAVAATLLAGGIPAWIGARANPADVLRKDSRQTGESRRSKHLRRSLVAAEAAISVALVLFTGLLVTSLTRLMSNDRGFVADHVITAEIDLPGKPYASTQAVEGFYRRVLGRLRRLPGVSQAGLVSVPPLGGDIWIDMVRVAGDARPWSQLRKEHFRWVSPGYLDVVHLPVVAGRDLTLSDEGKNYALVSELTARTLWPGVDPVGRQFHLGAFEQDFTVIGVVRNARTISLAHPDPMMVYVPYWVRCDGMSSIALRTRQDPDAMAEELRSAIWSVDAEVSVPVVRTLGGIAADSVATRRFEMDLLLLFATSALLLAGLGIYGVVAYSVAQRQQEIGLRLALGAQRSGIYRLVIGEGLQPVLVGAAVGVAVAFVSVRLISSQLFAVSPYNPGIAIGAVAVLLLVGTLGCVLPARHGASIDPMRALRNE